MPWRSGPRHGLRRGTALLLAAGVLAAVAVPTLAATPPTRAQRTTSVIKKLPSWGTYAVIVSLAKATTQQSVEIHVGRKVLKGVTVYPWAGADLAFYLHVKARRLTVRVIAASARERFTVALARQTIPPPAYPAAGTYVNAPANPYHTLVWSDEFQGVAGTAPNPANWTEDTFGGCGVNTLSTNTTSPANASLDGAGNLAITALPAVGQPGAYTSAQIDSNALYSFAYGRIEARMLLPVGQGLCSAFWLVGDSNAAGTSCWPNCGEIDIMEQLGQSPSQVSATLHGPIAATPGDGNNQQWQANLDSTVPLAPAWHTYGLIWSPGRLVWTLDGVPYATATPASLPAGATWVFDGHPFHIIMDLAVGGWPGPPSAATTFPASMRVAWVRVYH